jgi:hypothetical protein
MSTLLIVLLVLLLVGLLPAWPYSQAWGYYPSGIVSVLLVVAVLLLVFGGTPVVR